MRSVFADTGYWIALINRHDGLHEKAKELSQQLGTSTIVTSDMVLTEVLNAFAEAGPHIRKIAAQSVRAIKSDARIEVVPQTRRLFQEAFDLYCKRPDKDWSLTDCASFVIMQQREIEDAFAHDGHFEQNGFRALLRAS
jgi:predicted nucleic acid-binding protein